MRITALVVVLAAGCSEPLPDQPPPMPDMTVSLNFDFAGPPEPDLAEPVDLATADLTPVPRTLGFAPVARYGQGFVSALTVGDFNGDKHLDVAGYGQSCGIDLFLGSATGKLQLKGTSSTTACNGGVRAGDVGGDGKLDAIVFGGQNGAKVTVLAGKGDGTFLAPVDYSMGGQIIQNAAAGDLTGDKRADVVAASNTETDSMLGKLGGTLAAPVLVAGQRFVTAALLADLSGDGRLDMIVGLQGGVGVSLGKGNGTFAAETFTATTNNGVSMLAAGDVDRDGKLDLLLAEGPRVGVLLGDGKGGFSAHLTTFVPNNGFTQTVSAADFDGDGATDAVATGGNLGHVYVYLGKGDGTFATPADLDSQIDIIQDSATADLDGDGLPDIIVAGQGGIAVLLNTSK